MPELIFANVDMLINVILAFITMSLGLNLTKDDFKNIFAIPRSLTIGLIAQMVLLPLASLILMMLSDLPAEIKVGFMIISLCPGGVTSNLVNYLLKSNVALSISLTVINGLLCMFTIPILTNASLEFFVDRSQDIDLPVFDTIWHIALVTAIPAMFGMLIRSQLPKIADSLRPILKYALPALLLIIFAIKMFAPPEKGGISLGQDEYFSLGYWVILLNFSGMLLGFILGRIFNIRLKDRVTIMVEVGLQNTVLALYISDNILHSPEMQKPAIVYALITFVSTYVFAWLIKQFNLRLLKAKDE